MATGDFSIGAWIVNDRWRHDINHDHFGDLSTVGVVIESPIGPWEMGTPVQYVLDWLVQRVIKMESSNKFAGAFSVSAYILSPGGTITTGGTTQGIIAGYAIKQKNLTGAYNLNAIRGLVFTIDAVLRGYAELTIDAVIV
jgi:hypothetical protein